MKYNIEFPSFPNYTAEVYKGNEVAFEKIDFFGNTREYYQFWCGKAECVNGRLLCARFAIDKYRTIYINGNIIILSKISNEPHKSSILTNKSLNSNGILRKEEIDKMMEFIEQGRQRDCVVFRKIYERAKEILES